MKKFRNEFILEIDVAFEDEEKAHAFFIDSDWKESFWDLGDLEGVSEHLSYAFHQYSEEWDTDEKAWGKNLEGFGYFIYRNSDGLWVSKSENDEEFGSIKIRYENELECESTMEILVG